MKLARVLLLMLIFISAACSGGQPVRSYTKGADPAVYNFADSGTFEKGVYAGLATLHIQDGAYRIEVRQGDNTLWWGQWGATYTDVIVEADVQQMTEPNENAYGIMCRVRGAVGQPAAVTRSEGDGYLFVIQGGGQYAILRARGRSLTPLVNWTPSDAIHRGMATNTLRAVCAGTYLALYVNGTFLAETTDDTYHDGQAGLAASAANRLGTIIQFDNLTVAAPVAG